MQKIILDTTVLVSALIQKSYPYLIVNHLLMTNKIEMCISKPLIIEYYTVLKRPKFSKYPDFVSGAERLLADIESRAKLYHPQITLEIIKDFADNRLLELAVTCGADFLITGNTSDFTFSDYQGTQIISPKHYYENYISS
jgi:uncharacterized protein